VYGTQPVTFDGVYAGLALSGGAVVKGSNTGVRFGGKAAVTVPPGEFVWSDAVTLPFVKGDLSGRRMAVSFHVAGESGPMTWHAKGLTTSYLSRPNSGARGREEEDSSFPFTTTSYFFLDALEAMAPATKVVVAFGDSITDGTASTLNGDDRWPNFLARRLHARFGDTVTVVNAGIGGNRVAGPPEYSARQPFAGGPAAVQRLDRDVLGLSGVSTVIWLEGINDLGAGAAVDQITAGMRDGVARMKAKGIRVIGATVTSALNSTGASRTPEVDAKRKQLNEWIRTSGVFDGVADFDAATIDPASGQLRPEFIPDSTAGGAGDRIHPNRAGYQAMAASIDLTMIR
jgi:lysophospholipase L1-like esterase